MKEILSSLEKMMEPSQIDQKLDEIRAHAHEHGADVAYYVLSPALAAEKRAKFLGICDQCGRMEYVDVLPLGARMGGEGTA